MNAALRIYPAPRSILPQIAEILNAAFICRHQEVRKIFFSEEKKQKTFANSGVCAPRTVRGGIETGLFFRTEHPQPFIASSTEPLCYGKRLAWITH